jgi:sigma-E factor negative regulatory protein RseC
MTNEIRHSGIIEHVEEGHISVRILQTAACAGCMVAARCNAAEAREKIIDVYSDDSAGRYRVGDAVTVCTSRSVVSRAMTIGFVWPFLLMVFTLVVVLQLTGDESLSGLLAVGVLIPYYSVVWLLRERIGREVSFYIVD